jgi:UDP-N-acetylglucosamine:LPS N-acetylglucosamine transferase
MRELYALSDVVITKAGAITVSELTASNVPFILDTCPAIMPQEYGNVVFVKENELGLIANTIDEIPALVRKLVEDRSQITKQNDIRRDIYGTEKIGELIINSIKKR